MRLVPVTVLLCVLSQSWALPEQASDMPIEQLTNLANHALSRGDTSEALAIYDRILEQKPDDFSSLYKRATLRLALGQIGRAKHAFEEVLAIKEYPLARVELSRVCLKLGEYSEARKHLQQSAGDKEVERWLDSAEEAMKRANKAQETGNYSECVSAADQVMLHSPQFEKGRLLRAECSLQAGDFEKTIGDLTRVSLVNPALPSHLYIRLSLLRAFFSSSEFEISTDALGAVKQCLSADPDSKPCRKVFKSLKALNKQFGSVRNWVAAGRWTQVAVALTESTQSPGLINMIKELIIAHQTDSTTSPIPPRVDTDSASPLLLILQSTLCEAYVRIPSPKKAAKVCPKILEREPRHAWALLQRGDHLMEEEKFTEAAQAFKSAHDAGSPEAAQRYHKAQALAKQQKSVDYYKVLGVSRNADAKAIKKAYRAATLKAHPDKPGGSEEQMASLNQAYEVLSDPELRQRYDNGDDPNDSSQQGNPFQHGFAGGHGFGGFPFNFQGGGQQFAFGGGHFSFR